MSLVSDLPESDESSSDLPFFFFFFFFFFLSSSSSSGTAGTASVSVLLGVDRVSAEVMTMGGREVLGGVRNGFGKTLPSCPSDVLVVVGTELSAGGADPRHGAQLTLDVLLVVL